MFRALLFSFLLSSTGATGAIPDGTIPWTERKRPELEVNRAALERATVEDWPEEPASPKVVDAKRFAEAYEELCSTKRTGDPELSSKILNAANEFDVDPFLLAALTYRMSRCTPDKEAMGGRGLTLAAPSFFRGHLRHGVYRYHTKRGERFIEKHLRLDRYRFGPERLRRIEENLYFTAAYLHILEDQHETLDAVFEQVPHRSAVAHFVWGDRVHGRRIEDRILTDRRRLLEIYGAIPPAKPIVRYGATLGPPLEGSPRVITSFPGDPRDGGKRRHRGIDFDSTRGEPVLAIASGVVTFSGVDLPGRGTARPMRSRAANRFSPRRMGKGGRYVCIEHDTARDPENSADPPDRLVSCSMHLDEINVENGERVERGQRIGTVGRTGIKYSAPHLHFEVIRNGRRIDPSKLLEEFVIRNPPPKPKRIRRGSR